MPPEEVTARSRVVCCLFRIVGRGLDLRAKSRALRPGGAPKRACGRRPRRTLKNFKNSQGSAGVNARPTERRKRPCFPRTPRGTHPCREACMPPLQIRQTCTRAGNLVAPQTGAGRMHAAPTMRRKQQVNRVQAVGRTSTAGSRPRPTNHPERGCFPNRHQPSGRFARLRTRAGFQMNQTQ